MFGHAFNLNTSQSPLANQAVDVSGHTPFDVGYGLIQVSERKSKGQDISNHRFNNCPWRI